MIEFRTLPISKLWLGVFVALLAGILAAVGLLIPVPGDFTSLPTAASPEPDSGSSCLLLSFSAKEFSGPIGIRLTRDPAPPRGEARHLAYWTDLSPVWRRPLTPRWGTWRHVGGDSIVIVLGAHGLEVHTPTRGDTLVGRSGWSYYPNFWAAFTWPRSGVIAVRMACDLLAARAAA